MFIVLKYICICFGVLRSFVITKFFIFVPWQMTRLRIYIILIGYLCLFIFTYFILELKWNLSSAVLLVRFYTSYSVDAIRKTFGLSNKIFENL